MRLPKILVLTHLAKAPERARNVGGQAKRPDVAAHGAELLKLAPSMYHDLHASLNRSVNTTARPSRIPSLCTHFTRAGIEWRP